MAQGHPVPIQGLRRAAAEYETNVEAAQAIGIRPCLFATLCKRYGLETPGQRARKRNLERLAQMRRLQAEGWSVRRIARTLKVKHSTVLYWLNRWYKIEAEQA